MHERKDKVYQTLSQIGPNVYELYSVLVHRGGALGGHYYCYTKNMTTGNWYEFNDSSVSEIDESKVKETFGESSSSSSNASMHGAMMGYGATAYMLMYRKMDKTKNLNIEDVVVPENFKQIIESEIEKKKKKKEDKEIERSMISPTFIYEDKQTSLKIKKSATLEELIEKLITLFELDGKVTKDCLRLRNFNTYNQTAQEPISETSLGTPLDDLYFYSSKTYLVETKKKG